MSPVARLARLYPWSVDPDEDLRRAVAFLGWERSAAGVLRASYGAGLVGAALTLLLSAVAPTRLRLLSLLLSSTVTLVVMSSFTLVPRLLATARRVRALGDAPALVGRAVLSMRLSPSPERAAVFAARASDTPLADSLGRHVRQVRGTHASALERFGDEWAEWFPALARSLALVGTAAELPAEERDRSLDRALSVVLDGTRDQLRSFGEQIRGPLTALYAFGILLPTALVALLPAAHAAGVGVTPLSVAVVYDLLLPAVLVTAAAWLLARRPATFPPPAVRRSHPDVPDVPDRRLTAVLTGLAAGVAGWYGTALALPKWAPPIAAVGLGTGTALLAQYRPYLAVHERVAAVEEGLTDALALVGRRVSNGRSVESAVAATAEDVTGPIGRVFETAARQQRQLQVGVERAFVGEYGALEHVPSRRLRDSVAFLGLAASHGAPAGPAIRSLATHVDELQRVERSARSTLRSVCGTLQSTGTVFGPLVAGATVALADGMAGGGSGGLPGGGSELPWLGLAVGWYVLVLAAVLPTLSTGLVRGLDRALVAVRVGRALAVGTVVYLGSYLVVGGIA
ncbi:MULTISPECIES: type II secretion system F family protein [Salinibaculum]|uniref:type II secretion system F family protein n=1 Tax=Salinibaculum TaxID=2732368 RepID=UPI0030D424F0